MQRNAARTRGITPRPDFHGGPFVEVSVQEHIATLPPTWRFFDIDFDIDVSLLGHIAIRDDKESWIPAGRYCIFPSSLGSFRGPTPFSPRSQLTPTDRKTGNYRPIAAIGAGRAAGELPNREV